jgi:hypothetical protein
MIRCLVVVLVTGAACSSVGPPSVDGVLGADEWANARREELVGGGEVRLRRLGNTLYVAVSGPAPGIASLCLGDGDGVAILHASAALGTARYQQKGNGWTLANGFDWKVRESGQAAPSTAERDAFFSAEGWLANSSSTGAPVREFRIRLDANRRNLGVAYLVTGSRKIAYWPASMADDCRAEELIMGNTPAILKFTPGHWHGLS